MSGRVCLRGSRCISRVVSHQFSVILISLDLRLYREKGVGRLDFEIEFRAVGEGSKGGDCILIRYGSPQAYEVMVVDGGTTASGLELVEWIRTLCGKNAILTHAVCTHADGDHSSGLRELLKALTVKNLWMHVPWAHAAETRSYFKDSRWTDAGLAQKIRQEYDILDELVSLAGTKTTIQEPFEGSKIGPFTVLSPTRYAYLKLLPQFDATPEPDQAQLESEGWWLGKQSRIARAFQALIEKAQSWVDESWTKERLKNAGITSATNETSTVLYSNFEGRGNVLLTGDAGVNALTWALNYAHRTGISLHPLTLVQVPHHGSRRNVGPDILTRLLGDKTPAPKEKPSPPFAAVSSPKDDDTHPRKMLTNAFLRRGASVYATQGTHLALCRGFNRNIQVVPPLPFATKVEDYD